MYLKPDKEALDWERLWAPYDQPTYQEVLANIQTDDVVLEIGAGDLRLAYQLAGRARFVYAIEIQQAAPWDTRAFPDNLAVCYGDARQLPFPAGITTAVLLMRHCSHFRLYADKVRAMGCGRFITNARWRMGVEVIDLVAPRLLYNDVEIGWYACWCGCTGFVPAPAGQLTPAVEQTVYEVVNCPNCRALS